MCMPCADMATSDSRRSLGASSSHSLRVNSGDGGVIMGASAEEGDNVALMEDVHKNKQVGCAVHASFEAARNINVYEHAGSINNNRKFETCASCGLLGQSGLTANWMPAVFHNSELLLQVFLQYADVSAWVPASFAVPSLLPKFSMATFKQLGRKKSKEQTDKDFRQVSDYSD